MPGSYGSDLTVYRKPCVNLLFAQVPSLVRSVGSDVIHLMRQQTQFLWDTYFSSVEKIVTTTLEARMSNVFYVMHCVSEKRDPDIIDCNF